MRMVIFLALLCSLALQLAFGHSRVIAAALGFATGFAFAHLLIRILGTPDWYDEFDGIE